jgi:hypothetical protein
MASYQYVSQDTKNLCSRTIVVMHYSQTVEYGSRIQGDSCHISYVYSPLHPLPVQLDGSFDNFEAFVIGVNKQFQVKGVFLAQNSRQYVL